MDGSVDRASPRRGSLSSLHRQTAGPFSPGPKLASPASGPQANSYSLNNLYKDLDKFSRYFIIKAVQVIVQSRINVPKKVSTDSKPGGNDWFNINIADVVEISDKTKAALESECLSVKTNWRVCCEISLKTNDSGRVVLEHWILSNKSLLNSGQKPNISQTSPKSHQSSIRTSSNLLTTSNNVTGPLSTINSASTSRVRPSNGGGVSRTRLNSIDDCTGDNNFAANKLLVGANNENFDIKASTSCFALSTTSCQQKAVDQAATITATTTIPSSPSISSISSNAIQNQSTGQTSAQGSKTSAMSSIYTIYNRMSLLLKTIMTTTHIVPAYRLASRSNQSDSCVLCYRVYATNPSSQNATYNLGHPRGSIEDVSGNSDSPNRRSLSSNSSFGSINIRDFVGPDELDHFCAILKLGSIKTEVNQFDVSLCYRTDMKSSGALMRSPRSREMYNRILDDDCITAAKQLLAGHDVTGVYDQSLDNRCGVNGEYKSESSLDHIDKPLQPAFASKDQKNDKILQDPNLVIIESAFEKLLEKSVTTDDDIVGVASDAMNKPTDKNSKNSKLNNAQSMPIQVPTSSGKFKCTSVQPNLSSGSTPKSLTDSFVFVDLNPPFASEEQNDLNSFFHGPSPSFNQGFDSMKDVDELTNQLAVIEASASQIDDFVDNICVSEDEEAES